MPLRDSAPDARHFDAPPARQVAYFVVVSWHTDDDALATPALICYGAITLRCSVYVLRRCLSLFICRDDAAAAAARHAFATRTRPRRG